jgi:thiosulfate/3-mercaptopyruvate sulfurtransferase
MYQTVIDSQTLHLSHALPGWVIVDCRFDLADAAAGFLAYQKSHIPGAVYAHLDDDLSSPTGPFSGRHPLPSPAALASRFGRLGIDNGAQVVAYDDMNGAIASRLWWMLRYMGHEAAAVLDGGWQAWQRSGHPTSIGIEENEAAVFAGAPRADWTVISDEVEDATLLVDSRSPERYRGEIEPLDPVAGHIPGAINFDYERNFGPDGRLLSPDRLRQQLEEMLAGTPPAETVFYCGSGVSACANLLALRHAGLGDGRLYIGSWSEWIRDPERPVATGP